VINPVTHSTLFAGTYGGGVNRSINSGIDWLPCGNTGLANLNVLSLVSNSTGQLYAGTENGVYTSPDCDTWTAINGGLP
jgi:ligand-binding sensor domain-containing protein